MDLAVDGSPSRNISRPSPTHLRRSHVLSGRFYSSTCSRRNTARCFGNADCKSLKTTNRYVKWTRWLQSIYFSWLWS